MTSVAYIKWINGDGDGDIVNIHGTHSCWKQGALGAAGVRDGLQLGRSVRRTAGGGYCVATRIACFIVHLQQLSSINGIQYIQKHPNTAF